MSAHRLRQLPGSCPRSFWMLVCLFVAMCGTAVPSHAQEAAYYDPDAGSCPTRVIFLYQSGSTNETYVGYANRGSDAYFSPVFYSFSNVSSASGKRKLSGNFYLYGIECRLATWLRWDGVLTPPPSRYEVYESEPLACSGSRTGSLQPIAYEPGYDPYESSGGCTGGGSGTSGGGGGSGCHSEYAIVEVSYDGGATWQKFYEGYVTVCG